MQRIISVPSLDECNECLPNKKSSILYIKTKYMCCSNEPVTRMCYHSPTSINIGSNLRLQSKNIWLFLISPLENDNYWNLFVMHPWFCLTCYQDHSHFLLWSLDLKLMFCHHCINFNISTTIWNVCLLSFHLSSHVPKFIWLSRSFNCFIFQTITH